MGLGCSIPPKLDVYHNSYALLQIMLKIGKTDFPLQILTIFMKQVQEKNIDFTVRFMSTDETNESDIILPALGPPGLGRLKDL